MNAARRIADGVIKAAIVRSPLLSQYLSRKHRRILTGGNRAGEHSATPILNTQLAINNGVPAFRNHATKATFAGRRYLGLDSCPLGGGLKHDGFRVIARKSGAQVRLYSRPGNDLTHRLIIDGEAVARVTTASLRTIVSATATMMKAFSAFDLIELNGDDLRPDPLEGRKAKLEMLLAKAGPGIRFNEYMEGDGETMFRHACKLGLEGIVSKRKHSAYRSGRSPGWLKMKNAAAPAVKREAEEEWGRDKWR
jgi:hypothetical protein